MRTKAIAIAFKAAVSPRPTKQNPMSSPGKPLATMGFVVFKIARLGLQIEASHCRTGRSLSEPTNANASQPPIQLTRSIVVSAKV